MSVQKGFWKSAGFVGAVGTLAQGAAQLYGATTGEMIDADEVKAVVEQGTTLFVTLATVAASAISVYRGAKSVVGRAKILFAPKPEAEPLPWRDPNDQQPTE